MVKHNLNNDFLIKNIKARMVLDSRGNPTVEAEVFTEFCSARAIVPSGASTGKHEALELRDKTKEFHGLGVKKALNNILLIKKHILGQSVIDQKKIDSIMLKLDGTKNKSKLGANAILSISLAVSRCAAKSLGIPLWIHLSNLANVSAEDIKLPMCFSNIINGGKHSANDLMFQEFMIIPNYKTCKKNIQAMSEFYHELRNVIINKYGQSSVNVGDEGGFAPNISTPEEALDLLEITRKKTRLKINYAIDVAATEIYDKRTKTYSVTKSLRLNKKDLVNYYSDLIKKYPIISIEDPFAEDDFEGFSRITKKLGKKIQIVGDDLLVTNIKRIQTAHKKKLCNALLLKVNQIGTLTEAIGAFKTAKKYGWNVMVSHRSGETEDTFIADLAVGLGTGQIKAGAPCRTDRTAKYNQLLRIEEELNSFM